MFQGEDGKRIGHRKTKLEKKIKFTIIIKINNNQNIIIIKILGIKNNYGKRSISPEVYNSEFLCV